MRKNLSLKFIFIWVLLLTPFVATANILDIAESAMIREIILRKADANKYKTESEQTKFLTETLDEVTKSLSLPPI
jgi:hypothetical protein